MLLSQCTGHYYWKKDISRCPRIAIQNSFAQGQSRMTCKVLSRFRQQRHSGPITCWWEIKKHVGNLLWVHFHIKIWIFYGHGVFHIQFHRILSNWIPSCVYINLDASFTMHWPLLFGQISLSGWIWYCTKGIPLISSLISSSGR